jgi:beta-N-acetylhexosaminidase
MRKTTQVRYAWHWLLRAILFCSLLLGSLITPVSTGARSRAQSTEPEENARQLLESMTPEERVGQLFLVSFRGTDIDPGTPIHDLITNHHVGGVILSREKDNFIGPEGTPAQALETNRRIQLVEWGGSIEVIVDPTTDTSFRPTYVPLLIGVSQEGNGYPYDQILNGLTPLPNLLAIGATWDTNLAQRMGNILGGELSTIGFNLLIGPSLDVLDYTGFENPGDLGTRTFGGDPFWVGEMGRAYITGLREGGDGRIAVAGKHFPGLGGSDRLPTDEVATVRKTLEQLKLSELAPFFAVTGAAQSPESTVDALLTSHIRYQGLQGNLRATTSPISFDAQAFEQLMNLPQLATWRENGGVVISDELGSRAVRRFFSTSGQTFDGRLVARNAFLAGNDLLYLGDYSEENDPEGYTNTIRTLEFFAQKYREDPAFKERVDQSVIRILSLKYRLYDNFTLNAVLPPADGAETIEPQNGTSFAVASQAATLISPSPSELDDVLPNPPELNDRFVIFTDTYNIQQCSTCPEEPVLSREAFQEAVVNLYGPEAGGQILPYNIASFNFNSLADVLDTGVGDTLLERTTRRADWIVFLMLDEDPDRPTSLALRRFLDDRPDLYRRKRLVVFALDAPYYLDATDVIKLTAYYGLYSKQPQFIDVAARLLFKELRPIPGALPVTVPGIGYDLISATSPDPERAIQLFLDLPDLGVSATDGTPEPEIDIDLQEGEVLPLRTGVILDHNGNPVPDGTPVRFTMTIGGLESSPQVETTSNGVARTTFIINASGAVTIIARSGEPPAISNQIQFDVPSENEITPVPTEAATSTAPPSPEPTSTVVVLPPEETPIQPGPHTSTDIGDWLLALGTAMGVGWIVYWFSSNSGRVRWGVRWGLCALIGGMLVYTYLSLQLPGTTELLTSWGRWAVVLSALGGTILGLGGGLGWHQISRRASP